MKINNFPMMLDFKIEAPAHQMYKKGELTFVFDEKSPSALKKIDFKIDGVLYYINLLRVTGHNLTWIFHKEGSLKSVPRDELCKILQLSKDVNNITPFRRPYRALLDALPQQAEIYLQIMDKSITKEQKRALVKELSKRNNLLKNIVLSRGKEYHEGHTAFLKESCQEK